MSEVNDDSDDGPGLLALAQIERSVLQRAVDGDPDGIAELLCYATLMLEVIQAEEVGTITLALLPGALVSKAHAEGLTVEPDDEPECVSCGQSLLPDADSCWLCGEATP